MRWLTGVTALVALAVTPALALVCDARCLDAAAHTHQGPAVAAHARHGQATASHGHEHGRHSSDAPGRPAVTAGVALSRPDTRSCAARIDGAVPAAPRQWAPAGVLGCVAAFHAGPTPISDLPFVSDSSPPRSIPRLFVPLRI